jgi:hypothetical protein
MTYQPGTEPPNQPAYPPTGTPNAAAPQPARSVPQHTAPAEAAPAGLTSRDGVRPTRVSALWIGLTAAPAPNCRAASPAPAA